MVGCEHAYVRVSATACTQRTLYTKAFNICLHKICSSSAKTRIQTLYTDMISWKMIKCDLTIFTSTNLPSIHRRFISLRKSTKLIACALVFAHWILSLYNTVTYCKWRARASDMKRLCNLFNNFHTWWLLSYVVSWCWLQFIASFRWRIALKLSVFHHPASRNWIRPIFFAVGFCS